MATVAKKVPIPKNGVDYRGKVVLAPMVRSGECPSRLMALKYGADLVWGPETVDQAIIGCTRRVNSRTGAVEFSRVPSNMLKLTGIAEESVVFRLHPELEGRKLIYQVGSANPTLAVAAAKTVAADVAGIDLNCGCPKPFSTHGGMGAALLQTPDLLCSILRALVSEVGEPYEIGISVKIRLLETPDLTRALVSRLVQTGVTGLTIHCRTTPMRPRERAIREQLKMIGEICRDAGVACLMNGDVTSREEAIKLAKDFDVDGAMIATAAQDNPSVFRSTEDGGTADWKAVVEEYIGFCMQVENKWSNTKYLLGKMVPGKSPFYKLQGPTKCYSDLVKVYGWTEQYADRAREVDTLLQLGEFEKPKPTKAEKQAARKALQMDDNNVLTAGVKRKADDAALDDPTLRIKPEIMSTSHPQPSLSV